MSKVMKHIVLIVLLSLPNLAHPAGFKNPFEGNLNWRVTCYSGGVPVYKEYLKGVRTTGGVMVGVQRTGEPVILTGTCIAEKVS